MNRFQQCRSTAAVVVILVLQGWAMSFASVQHETMIRVKNRFFVERSSRLREIADVSFYCVSCHDGKTAPARGENIVVGRGLGTGTHTIHPVGMTYPNGRPDFNDLSMVDPRITMISGKVTCVSCHSYRTSDHQLTVDRSRSRLCLECHRK